MNTDDLREEYGERVTQYNWQIDDDLWTDEYVLWLEKQLLIQRVSQQRELLIAFAKYMEEDKMYARHDEANADDFLEKYSN